MINTRYTILTKYDIILRQKKYDRNESDDGQK